MNRIFILVFLGLVGFCRLNAQTEFIRQNNSFSESIGLRESESVLNIQEYNPEAVVQANSEDQLKSSTASPAATYKHPSGYLGSGYSRENTLLIDSKTKKNVNLHIGNAYVPTQWESTKNTDTQYVEWNFDGQVERADNPVVTFQFGIQANPILSAVNGNQVTEFQQGKDGDYAYNLFQLGGENKWLIDNNKEVVFGLGNYDASISREFALDMIPKELNTDGFAKLKGIGNKFDKPVAPFLIRSVYIFCVNIEPKDNEPVKLNIYSMVNGAKGTLLASSTAERSSYVNIGSTGGGNYLYMIPFSFSNFIEISTDYFIEFVNYKSCGPLFQGISNSDGTNYAYLVFDDKIEPLSTYYTDRNTGGRLNTSFCINLDAVFPFLYSESPTYKVLPAGGTKKFNIKTYWDPATDWTLESKLPDWIKIGNYTTESATNTVFLPVEVSAMPDNISSRGFEIKYKSYGCNLSLTIDQDKKYVGIETVSKNQIKASCQNDYFCLEYPVDVYQTVSVYNVAGQKINEYRLDTTGTSLISTSNLPKGIYLLKFGGAASQSVKIVKE